MNHPAQRALLNKFPLDEVLDTLQDISWVAYRTNQSILKEIRIKSVPVTYEANSLLLYQCSDVAAGKVPVTPSEAYKRRCNSDPTLAVPLSRRTPHGARKPPPIIPIVTNKLMINNTLNL
ncbi:unnamed protein product [Leptidea sinapis]|uniref:Uncharacterized protein n=1 Tax=Leptidea sinapis TaxID=189913 RepID=A0A5E4QIN0_9NEOP|nr:unnamed protein product [Leptidea sinapis]